MRSILCCIKDRCEHPDLSRCVWWFCENCVLERERSSSWPHLGDYVLLKVSPWKGVVCFGKKGKLAPRFVRPFEIIEKCLVDPTLQVPLDEIRVDAKLNFVEEPVEILEREFKKLKRSRISICPRFDGIQNVDLNSRGNVKIR
ncbi:hypothetical protein Tco_0635339 [Tanacetum coccineum]